MSRPRILGGSARGRPLETPKKGTRPSPSRLREALFNVLEFRERGPFLDLFSGSGAIGLEAASRGWDVTCVDLSREAAAVLRRNARSVGVEAEVIRDDAVRVARRRPGAYRVVAAAPPYPLDLPPLFQEILDAGPAGPGGIYVLQHPSALAWTPRLGGREVGARVRRYGSNALTLVEVPEADPAPEPGAGSDAESDGAPSAGAPCGNEG